MCRSWRDWLRSRIPFHKLPTIFHLPFHTFSHPPIHPSALTHPSTNPPSHPSFHPLTLSPALSQELTREATNITLDDEQAVMEYHAWTQLLARTREEICSVLRQPEHCVPFMQVIPLCPVITIHVPLLNLSYPVSALSRSCPNPILTLTPTYPYPLIYRRVGWCTLWAPLPP